MRLRQEAGRLAMPTSKTVPPARRASWVTTATLALVALLAIGAAYFAGKRAGAVQELLAASPSAARGIGLVRKQPCATGWCETLWLGAPGAGCRDIGGVKPPLV